ncbi:DUF2516 family protein [Marinactinospora thermotolerans]|uniref:DUF2516 domain-containing protein n=1 Tax=Marinactinospora thermotolerans DSM 45154 TaxID=1122192 RepID=A0A1T4N073_9ACTN|nr:DUF2516 family protein [Marinactinospora thermotolerans]SJZ72531.1 Protein of unknown function [Marinactinospora thermotolerans DSM 45154]
MVALSFFSLLWKVIYLAIFVTTLYALVEAVRTPAQAFPAMDKQTKGLWVGLLGAGTLLSLSAVLGYGAFLTILSLIVSLIYLLDVRPAVKSIGRPGDGPYGPW